MRVLVLGEEEGSAGMERWRWRCEVGGVCRWKLRKRTGVKIKPRARDGQQPVTRRDGDAGWGMILQLEVKQRDRG